MRRIAVVIPLLALGAAEPTAMPRPVFPPNVAAISPAFPDCQTLHIADNNEKATFRRLGDLPRAEAYQAVLRAGPDGCSNPLLVSERISGPRQKPAN